MTNLENYREVLFKHKLFVKKEISDDVIKKVLESNKFRNWVDSNLLLTVEYILIENVFMFGNEVGFIVARLHSLPDKHFKKTLPGITLIRGDSVVILPVFRVKETGFLYTVLTEQYRVPVGRMISSSPAGMLDDGSIQSAILNEFKEEIDPTFDFEFKDFKLLGKSFSSDGVLDEKVYFYSITKEITSKELASYNEKITGAGEHEQIMLKVVPLDSLKDSEDLRLFYAYHKYMKLN